MARKCLVCESQHLKEIDKSLVAGEPYRALAQRCGISPDAVFRHKGPPFAEAPGEGEAIEEVAKADTLLDQARNLLPKAERLTKRAEEDGAIDTALRGVSQIRGVLELLGQVSGQLAGKGTTQVNVGINLQAPNFRSMSDYELKQFLASKGHAPLIEAQITSAGEPRPGSSGHKGRNMSLPVSGRPCISPSMPCPEYLRLEQRYEAALRNWVQSMALVGQPTVEARQRAMENRNTAKERLWVHEQSCSICLRMLAPPSNPRTAA